MTAALLFVESNTTGTGMLMLEAAQRLGFEPVLLAADHGRYRPPAGTHTMQVDTASLVDLRRCAANAGARVAGVLSSSEYFIHMAARLAESLGLPSFGAEAIQTCRDKHAQRALLFASDVPCPRFTHVATFEQLLDAAATNQAPVVLKPCFGSGSVGVKLCRSRDEIVAHGRALLGEARNERGMTQSPELLVEEYVEGDEYSIEVLAGRVLGVTRKHLGALPHFVERGHDFPAPLTEQEASALERAALRSVTALGLLDGPAHVEVRLRDSRPLVIEVNPRLAGGFIPELVRLATGVNVLEEVIRLAAGGPVSAWAPPRRSAAIRFACAPCRGVLQHVSGESAAGGVPGVVDVKLYRSAGERLEQHGDFRDRFGHVIAVADDAEGAGRAADLACALLRAVVEPC